MRHLQKLYWFTSRRSCSCQQCAQHPGCGHGGLPGVNANGIWFPNCWLPPKKGSHICVKERSKLILWIKKLTQKAFHQSDFSFGKKNMYFSEILFCVSALPEFIKQKKGKKRSECDSKVTERLLASAGSSVYSIIQGEQSRHCTKRWSNTWHYFWRFCSQWLTSICPEAESCNHT